MIISPYDNNARKSAALGFIASVKPLEGLDLIDSSNDIPLSTLLSAHGTSLRKLALHESIKLNEFQELLSLAELDQIGKCCPLLEDLTIYVGNDELDDLRRMISALAILPNLYILTIYIKIGSFGKQTELPCMSANKAEEISDGVQKKKNPLDPVDDDCWLENIWSVLRTEKRRHKTPTLQELHTKIRKPPRTIGVGFRYPWIETYFIAKQSERDDRPDEILVQEVKSSSDGKCGSLGTKTIPQIIVEN